MTFTPSTSIGVPTQVGPSGTVGTLQPTLEWGTVTGATAYEWRVLNSLGWLILKRTTTGTSQQAPLPLNAGESYTWQVRALVGSEPGPWSGGMGFTPQP